MADPKITVLINAYNQHEWIAKAVRSVLAQTLPAWEILVVDDGSTDGTREMAEREFGDRIRYHYHQNQGIGRSRNVGIGLATGDWIAFLDGDDHWLPEKLELQAAALAAHPAAAMVCCAWFESTPDDRIMSEVSLPRPFTMKHVRSELRRRGIFTPSATIVRRDVLLEVCGFPEDIFFAEDCVTFTRVAAKYEVAGVERALVYKTQWPQSLSSQPDAALRDGLVSLRLCHQALASGRWPQSWVERIAFRQSVTQLFFHTAWVYAGRRDARKALLRLAQGLMHWPFLTLRQYRSVYWLCSELFTQ